MLWTLPDGHDVDRTTPAGSAPSVGETMSGTLLRGGRRRTRSSTTRRATRSSSRKPPSSTPPRSTRTSGRVDIANVVAVSGTAAALSLLEFESALNPADAADLQWQHGEGSDAHTRTGPDFVLIPSTDPGTSYIVVTDAKQPDAADPRRRAGPGRAPDRRARRRPRRHRRARPDPRRPADLRPERLPQGRRR